MRHNGDIKWENGISISTFFKKKVLPVHPTVTFRHYIFYDGDRRCISCKSTNIQNPFIAKDFAYYKWGQTTEAVTGC